jgi:hypothetical protein
MKVPYNGTYQQSGKEGGAINSLTLVYTALSYGLKHGKLKGVE